MDEQVLAPTGHHVIVRVDKPQEKTAGGLYIPETVKDRKVGEGEIGTLIAVGPQAWMAFADGRPWAQVGDRVVCVKYAGKSLEGRPEIRIMNDEDILAVVSDITAEV